jgi:hypothetical protein
MQPSTVDHLTNWNLMHVAYFFLEQLVPETYKAGQGIKNTQQPVPETYKEGRGEKLWGKKYCCREVKKNSDKSNGSETMGKRKSKEITRCIIETKTKGRLEEGVADHSFQTIKNEPHKGGAKESEHCFHPRPPGSSSFFCLFFYSTHYSFFTQSDCISGPALVGDSDQWCKSG